MQSSRQINSNPLQLDIFYLKFHTFLLDSYWLTLLVYKLKISQYAINWRSKGSTGPPTESYPSNASSGKRQRKVPPQTLPYTCIYAVVELPTAEFFNRNSIGFSCHDDGRGIGQTWLDMIRLSGSILNKAAKKEPYFDNLFSGPNSLCH